MERRWELADRDTAVASYVEESAAVLQLVIGWDGIVRSANRFTETLVGRDPVGSDWKDIVVDFGATLTLEGLCEGDGRARLLNIATAGGLPETFLCRAFPGEEDVVLAGSLDVTESARLRAEVLRLNQELANTVRALEKANAELRSLGAMKDRFLGMAAHDLRKPVGLVLAYGDLLTSEAASRLTEEERGFLDAVVTAGDFMRGAIDNFLDYALIEGGRFRVERRPADVRSLLGETLTLLEVAARRRQVGIDVQIDGGGRLVSLDRSKVEQALLNVVGNAVEHSPPGGTVGVEVVLRGSDVVVIVRDQGEGIPADVRRTLFEAYRADDRRRTGRERSVGLGLAIARLIVEAHGGAISAESQPGRGSSFTMTFPTTGAPSPEPGETSR